MIGLPFSIRIHTLLNFPAKGFCYGRKHNLSVYNIQAVFLVPDRFRKLFPNQDLPI